MLYIRVAVFICSLSNFAGIFGREAFTQNRLGTIDIVLHTLGLLASLRFPKNPRGLVWYGGYGARPSAAFVLPV